MGKSITTLVEDIYKVLDQTNEHNPDALLASEYAVRIGGELAKSTLKRDKPRELGKLWASDLGKPCMRQHWYNFNMPEAGAQLLGHTKFKFLYGNVLEEVVLYMAEEAGHEVTNKQDRVEVAVQRDQGLDWEITGRIDAFIDGVLVDVKTTSSYGFTRYKDGIDPSNDSFGYLYQLGFYDAFGGWDGQNEDKGFVWIDKQNGYIKYTPCVTPDSHELLTRANCIVDAVIAPTVVPIARGYHTEPYGKSGNMCLPISCSYCAYKKECWKDANGGRGLRTYAYNHKPIHFTNIVREPKVPEITEA